MTPSYKCGIRREGKSDFNVVTGTSVFVGPGKYFFKFGMKSEVILKIVLYIVLVEVEEFHFMVKFGLKMKCIFYCLLLKKWVFIGKILEKKIIILMIILEIEDLVLK